VVRATDLKPLDELPGVTELGIPSRGESPEVFTDCDLIVLSDVPFDLPNWRRPPRVRVIGEVGWPRRISGPHRSRDYGLQRQDHHHQPDGHILREAGVAVQVGGNIGLPSPPWRKVRATMAGTCWNSSFQLETIDEFRRTRSGSTSRRIT
jgi:hypothetical protein